MESTEDLKQWNDTIWYRYTTVAGRGVKEEEGEKLQKEKHLKIYCSIIRAVYPQVAIKLFKHR